MAFLFFRLVLVLVLLLVPACSGDGGSGGQGEEKDAGPLVVDLDALADRYADVDLTAVIEVSFDEPLDVAGVSDRDAAGAPGLAVLEESGWIRLYREDPLEAVPGTVYAARDGGRLVYVPSAALEPGAEYRVVLSSDIAGVSGRTVGQDLSFPVTTVEDGVAVRVVPSTDVAVQGSPVRFSAQCASGAARVLWDFDEASPGKKTAEGAEVEYAYESEGAYRAGVEVTDSFGRVFTGGAQITVLPDLERELSGNPLVQEVEVLSTDDLADRTSLEEALAQSAGGVVSMAVARIGPEGESGGVPVVKVEVRPLAIPQLRRTFAERAAEAGRFLGVVRFLGIPAVLAGGCDGDSCTLDLLLDEGAFQLEGRLGDRDVRVDEPALSAVPAVYALSLVVTRETIDNLRASLPDVITEPLCRLSLEADNTLRLAVPQSARRRTGLMAASWGSGFVDTVVGTVTGAASSVGQAVGDAVEAGAEMAQSIWDFLAGDEIDLLGSLAGLASDLVGLDPVERAKGVGDALGQVYDAFQTLRGSFSEDPGGLISTYTDPSALVEDLGRFVDGNGGNDLASLFRRVVDRLNGSVDSLGTNPFQAMADLLAAGSRLEDLLGDLSDGEDAEAVLSVGSSTSLKIQKGSTSRTFTLGEIDAWRVDDFADVLPDFPLADLITDLTDLAETAVSGLQMEIGLVYDAGSRRFSVRYRTISGSTELYGFEAFLSDREGAGIEIQVNDPLHPDTGITVQGALPGVSVDPLPPGPAGDLLDSVYAQSTVFPELTAEIRARYRKMLATVRASTRPQISFGVGLSMGFELDYYVAIGGRVAGSIGVSASMDAGDALDSLKTLLKNAFDAARRNLGLEVSARDGGVPMVSFPDEDALMAFLKDFLGRVKQQAPDVFDDLQVAVAASAKVGLGLGAGGTGTGGAGGDLAGQMGVEVGASAADLYRIASFCVDHGSALLFSGITDQVARYQNAAAGLDAVFDVDSIPGLFRDGLEELVEEVSPYELDDFIHTLATGMSVTLSVSVGADAEGEEVVSGGVDLDTSMAISANGELILNGLLESLRMAGSLAGLDEAQLYQRIKIFDQPAVFPEIAFSALPLQAEISAGLDEGIKVEVKAGAQAVWLSGAVSLQGDPYRTTDGAVSGTATVSGFPAVVVTRTTPEPLVDEPVTFTAAAEARPGASIAGYAWAVDGTEAGAGSALTRSFETTGLHVVTLTVTQSDGAATVRTLRVNVPNQPPPAPVLHLEEPQLSPDGSIPFGPVADPEGDPVSYEVEVLQVPGHVAVSSDYFTLEAETHRIVFHGLPTGDYEVRIRAVGAGEPGPWSDPLSVSVVPGAPTLVSPAEWASLWYEDCVVFEWNTDEESSQLQIAASADFEDPEYSEWFEGSSSEICPSSLPEGGSLDAGQYFWRVRVAPVTGTPSPWSEVRPFHVVDNHKPAVPQLVQPPAASYYTRDTITFAFEAADPDGDPITYTIELSQPEMTLTSTTGTFVIEPGRFAPGEVVFLSIEVSDGRGGVTGMSFAPWGFDVLNSPPDAPVAVSPEDGTLLESGTVTLQVGPAADFDGDPIQGYEFHVLRRGADAWQTYPSEGPSLTLTGLARDTYLWKARALAASGTTQGDFSKEREFTLKLNRPPVAVTVAPEAGAMVSAAAPGRLEASATDPDGDPVAWYEFQLSSDPEFNKIWIEEKVGEGTLPLEELKSGTYFWRVRAADRYSDEPGPWSEPRCFSAIVTLPAPTVDTAATPGTFGPPEGETVELRIAVEPGLYDCLQQPAGVMSYQIGPDPEFSSTLAAGTFMERLVVTLEPGLYYFRVRQRAGDFESPWSDPFRFGVQGSPSARDDAYTTAEDTALEVAAPGVLANDTDPNGDALTAERVRDPDHGALDLSPDGGFTYMPEADFHGTDVFTYRVSDGSTSSAPVEVRISVQPVDDPPVARDDAYTTAEDTALEVAAPGVLANDTDPDGDALTAEGLRGPDHGTLEFSPDGGFAYMPEADFHGADTFTYSVTDGKATDTATVRVTVAAVNDAPELEPVPDRSVNEGDTLSVDLSASDPDGDALAFDIESPAFCSLEDHGDGTATLTCSPGSGDAGRYTVNVSVEDEGDPPLADETSFVITVTGTSADPVENGGFEDGLDPWVSYEPGVTGTLTIEVVSADGSRRLHYLRSDSGSSGGEMYAHQTFEGVDLSHYSEVYLECDVKLVDRTLASSGSWSYYNGGHGEWPAEIRFVNSGDESYEWHHGFADFDDTYERSNYTKVELGAWYHYRSPNLKEVQTTETGPHNAPIESGPPTLITEVKVGGSGWDFEGYFDNVKLILVE